MPFSSQKELREYLTDSCARGEPSKEYWDYEINHFVQKHGPHANFGFEGQFKDPSPAKEKEAARIYTVQFMERGHALPIPQIQSGTGTHLIDDPQFAAPLSVLSAKLRPFRQVLIRVTDHMFEQRERNEGFVNALHRDTTALERVQENIRERLAAGRTDTDRVVFNAPAIAALQTFYTEAFADLAHKMVETKILNDIATQKKGNKPVRQAYFTREDMAEAKQTAALAGLRQLSEDLNAVVAARKRLMPEAPAKKPEPYRGGFGL